MEERVTKLFQVMDVKSGRKCMIGFEGYSTFAQRCKLKFGYPDDSDVLFELEDGNIEIDETAFPLYPNSTRFRMRLISDDNEKPDLMNVRDTGAVSGKHGTHSSGEQSEYKPGATAAKYTEPYENIEADLFSGSAEYKAGATAAKYTESYENIEADLFSGSAEYKPGATADKYTESYENIEADLFSGSDAVDEDHTIDKRAVHVTVMESPIAKLCNIVGRMTMFIGNNELVFANTHTGHPKYTFRFSWIRRFGVSSKDIFHFEIGRKCPNGEGEINIRTSDAKDIHKLLHKKCNQSSSIH